MNTIYGYVLSFLCVFGVIGLVTLLRSIFHLNNEISRKLIHTFVAFTWLPMYFYLSGTIHIVIVPIIFTIVNYLSAKLVLFKAMERESESKKKDWGTVYFAICMSLMSILSLIFSKLLIPYGIAVFCLSFGDGAAAIAGTLIKKHNFNLTKGKSFVGTLACFVFAFLGVYFICFLLSIPIKLPVALLLAACTAIFELIGGKLDNFTVSLGVMIVALLTI